MPLLSFIITLLMLQFDDEINFFDVMINLFDRVKN